MNRFNMWSPRYRLGCLAVIAIVATGLVAMGHIVPSVAAYISNTSMISYLVVIILAFDIGLMVRLLRIVQFVPNEERFMPNQDESMAELISAVPKCERADLLEYAAATTLPLIRSIMRENVPMRLLLKHPDTVEGHQRQRMITTLDTLYTSIFAEYSGKYEIRCYRLPYSVRGRHLHGRLLELGWLTPDPYRQSAFGHANPSALIAVSDTPKEYLREFFDKTFAIYWNHSETEDALTVLRTLQAAPALPVRQS
jgi:hypothetical protein